MNVNVSWMRRIRKARDWQDLGVWWNSPEQKRARRDFDLTKEEVADLVAFVKARLAQLRQPQAAIPGRTAAATPRSAACST